MPKDYPDHHDAEIILKLYELRREPVMRESRHAINRTFWPKSWDEVAAVMKPDHPLNAAFRQTSTYWEMVYGMAKHGVVHADFLMESCGEGMVLLAKMRPYLEQYRQASSPRAFANAEWISTHTETGRQVFATQRTRVEKTLAGKS
jgi:hypothetical protein